MSDLFLLSELKMHLIKFSFLLSYGIAQVDEPSGLMLT